MSAAATDVETPHQGIPRVAIRCCPIRQLPLPTVLTTDQKGAIAEAEIVAAVIRLGIGVYKPVSDGERCDLIFECDRRLLRVQCKWAPRHGDVVVVRCRSCRRTGTEDLLFDARL
jgi:predicted RNA-binding Zn-ribbon protein involved in translation (DUF1610 family)